MCWKTSTRGLIDFGLLFGGVDVRKYDTLPMPACDRWGVLMRRDAPLASKETICPEDLWDKPLIVSHQRGDDSYLSRWMKREIGRLNVVATYNLVYNASLLVDEGLGYALTFDGLINTEGSDLCFRPLAPQLEAPGSIVWKKVSGVLQAGGGVFAVPARHALSGAKKEIAKSGKMAVYYW